MSQQATEESNSAVRVSSQPLGPAQWESLGVLHAGMASVFKTAWDLSLVWDGDGLPSIVVGVWAPEDDYTCYDDRVMEILNDERNLPPGYEFTGWGSGEPVDGSIRRIYDLDPKERGPE